MSRLYLGPPGLLMADHDIPDRFWPAIRLVVNNLVWILPLVAIEQGVAGRGEIAVVLAILFVADLIIAVKWGLLEKVIGDVKRMSAIQVGLLVGIIGTWAFLTLGLGAGAWMIWTGQGTITSNPAANVPADAGPLIWFKNLTMQGGPNVGRNVFALIFHGGNSSQQEIRLKSASIISAVDGKQIDLLVSAENEWVPIDQINLVPAGAPIQLLAKFGPPDPNAPGKILGLPAKEFLDSWKKFTLNVTDEVKPYRIPFNEADLTAFFPGMAGPHITKKQKQ